MKLAALLVVCLLAVAVHANTATPTAQPPAPAPVSSATPSTQPPAPAPSTSPTPTTQPPAPAPSTSATPTTQPPAPAPSTSATPTTQPPAPAPSSSSTPTTQPPAPVATATPTATATFTSLPSPAPPAPISINTGKLTASPSLNSISFTGPTSSDKDYTYAFVLVNTVEQYNNSGKWVAVANSQKTYNWSVTSGNAFAVGSFTQAGVAADGSTITILSVGANNNLTIATQTITVGAYKWANTSKNNFLTLTYTWTATDSKGKVKAQKVMGNEAQSLIAYGSAFFSVGDKTYTLTYDKKNKNMQLLAPFSAAAIVVPATFGTNVSTKSLSTIASTGMPAWAILLIVVGAILFLIAIIAAGVGGYMMYQKKRQGYEAI